MDSFGPRRTHFQGVCRGSLVRKGRQTRRELSGVAGDVRPKRAIAQARQRSDGDCKATHERDPTAHRHVTEPRPPTAETLDQIQMPRGGPPTEDTGTPASAALPLACSVALSQQQRDECCLSLAMAREQTTRLASGRNANTARVGTGTPTGVCSSQAQPSQLGSVACIQSHNN